MINQSISLDSLASAKVVGEGTAGAPSGGVLSVQGVTGGTSISTSSGGNTPNGFARNLYSSTSVTTSAYVQLIASTTNVTNVIEIFDSSGQTMAIAFGSSGSEVQQFIVYPGGNGRMTVSIPAGTRISVIALSATASSGEIDLNLYT